MSCFPQRRQLLVISLDGLSCQQFQALSSRLSWVSQLTSCAHAKMINTHQLVSTQAIWSEFLTGCQWYESDCPGYARPTTSLNHLTIISEDNLARPVTLVKSV